MLRRTAIQALVGSALFALKQRAMAQPASANVVSSLAPSGSIRVAINYGNAVLARRDPATGKLTGVSVDIAEELGRRLASFEVRQALVCQG